MELEELKRVFKNRLKSIGEAFVDVVRTISGSEEARKEAADIVDTVLKAVDRAGSAEVLFNIAYKFGQIDGVTVAKWLLASNGYHVAALLVRGLGAFNPFLGISLFY